jgi:hypothetical protein
MNFSFFGKVVYFGLSISFYKKKKGKREREKKNKRRGEEKEG